MLKYLLKSQGCFVQSRMLKSAVSFIVLYYNIILLYLIQTKILEIYSFQDVNIVEKLAPLPCQAACGNELP